MTHKAGIVPSLPGHSEVPFQPRQLLWNEIEPYLAPSEVDEIRLIIGNAILDENETLYTEVVALLEIWNGYKRKMESANANASPVSLGDSKDRMLLERKISILIDEIKKKCQHQGISLENTLLVETPREKNIVDYVTRNAPVRPRSASTNISSQSVNTPIDPRTPSMSPRNLDITRISPRLNVVQIEEVKDQIIAAVLEEKRLLLSDIEFLQKCLEDEWLWNASSTKTTEAPSYKDLKEFSTKLEKSYLSNSPPVALTTPTVSTLSKAPKEVGAVASSPGKTSTRRTSSTNLRTSIDHTSPKKETRKRDPTKS
ncbi:hypothetical protein PROFUN_04984 [Planoprotostelium fungivorum]|uniref:Uncharacterized protein n=1 Tax=Planoprotostelium fungivorum TaxID=1890364 RepID=A0A2P6NSR2_9EUKA|nr:hypothetical protein PROFUN_04984 [Planoprotostelium fungivorum]